MAGFTQPEILLLLKLVLAHCLTDFALQPSKWVEDRARRKYKSKYLYYHIGLTGAVTLLLTQSWDLTLWITATHLLIDLWKAYQKRNTFYFLLDQVLHFVVLGTGWLFYVEGRVAPEAVLMNYRFMVYLTGFFIATFPLSIVIKVLTAKWGNGHRQPRTRTTSENGSTAGSPPSVPEDSRWTELKEAGRWIGIIERVLIISFVLLDQYEAIGFLIAAKTIIRFKETDQRKSEYFLFGTLLSISLSIFLALGMKLLLGLK
ncbi:DUF3307 domain-containing protein [Rufibacter glacialis]|uniref:DUF3307 domain-containing protein n=1 Tax=Rufibacter glacialis TaxID=1259555 RepID=A0A5M8QHD9_9BACT|nr:DUF3307 domain-containing protein [Rufibacter glacialis]KAA6434350.1 DUF3307 domain-containing protein [Rufibacter glacialis]GGK68771.1 membrane protein [Rufibacter glacialis]